MTDIKVSPCAILTFRSIMAGGADLTDILANGKAKEIADLSPVGPAFVRWTETFCVMFDLSGWYPLIARVVAKPKIVAPITATGNLPFKHALTFSGNVNL